MSSNAIIIDLLLLIVLMNLFTKPSDGRVEKLEYLVCILAGFAIYYFVFKGLFL